MKKNTVILDIKDYNYLRDFVIAINGGLTAVKDYDYSGDLRTWYISKDLAIKELDETNKRLLSRIDELYKENIELKDKVGNLIGQIKSGSVTVTNPTIDDFKKMSVWQFIKYKRKLK